MVVDRGQWQQLEEALARLPRVSLAHLPTPLEEAPRLSAFLGGPRLLIKREDATGLALGGNKTRMFEFVLGEVVREGYDTVVGGAAVQSNYCRQLAAACAKLGLECHLVLRRVRGEKDNALQGGLLLDLLLGANVKIIDGDWAVQAAEIRNLAHRLTAQGRRVYLARVGNESRLGLYAVAYCSLFSELLHQLKDRDIEADRIWVCSSDTTQAGLVLANKYLGSPFRVTAVPALKTPVYPKKDFPVDIAEIANEAAAILGLEASVDPSDVESLADYVGEGYGKVTPGALEALHKVARLEGILLDPVYTAKAMAGLMDHIAAGQILKEETVIFIHTGGTPALFAYADELGVAL